METYAHLRENGSQGQDINKYTVADEWNEGGIWYDGVTFTGDNKTTLEAADDAASANWGNKWRMPTGAEWKELYNNTNLQWTDDYNGTGVAGYILTSTITGHTDASIFLPAAGYRDNGHLGGDGWGQKGFYWSASLGGESPSSYSHYLGTGIGESGIDTNRYYGFSVRPVCPAE